MEDQELIVRKNIYDVVEIKRLAIAAYDRMLEEDKNIDALMKSINHYTFYDFRFRGDCHGETRVEKEIDKKCWAYMIKIYNLEKYMLCTEHEKLRKQIESYDFPEFTLENAEAWLLSLKKTVYDSVQKLVEDVFDRITQDTYWTGGSSYSTRVKKKRNNNSIDKHFILTTYDCSSMAYWSGRPTLTDDLEKACYIIDGKLLPEVTLKSSMNKGKIWESENDYFRIRVCQNGNTHYWIKDAIRERLNLYGSKRGVIGQDIKIKIFEKD